MKKFHDALKTIYGTKSSGATTMLSVDGSTLLTDKEAILKRWAEHFNSVLNRPSSINEDADFHRCNVLLDEFPTVMETRKAVQQLSSGKAPGADVFDCPPRFIAMVRQFHDGMQARVQNDGKFSEPFEVTNGVKQGCVMAPTMFSMMFSAMLMDVFQDSDTGFPIRYRFDGNIYNLRWLQAKTKVQAHVLDELLYADDMDKNASSEAKMQRAMDQVSQSCD